MTLRVIGAGAGRTGTESLKLALEQLLAVPCYHMYEAFQRPTDFPTWAAAARGSMPDWGDFFQGFGAAVDAPVAAFWPELMKTYPDAFILLSIRDADGWWQSVSRTIIPLVRNQQPGPFREMMEALGETRWPFPFLEERDAKLWFEGHNSKVRAEVPSERLIEWKLGDGWEPICNALSIDIPKETFPHANKPKDFQERHPD